MKFAEEVVESGKKFENFETYFTEIIDKEEAELREIISSNIEIYKENILQIKKNKQKKKRKQKKNKNAIKNKNQDINKKLECIVCNNILDDNFYKPY